MDIAVNSLQKTFYHLYADELPSFVDTLKTTQNLPDELLHTIETVEKNIEKNRTLLSSLLQDNLHAGFTGATTTVLDGAIGGILGRVSKKQAMKKFSGKRLVAIQDSATLFENTIQRMEQLLENTEEKDSSKRNYENLTASEKIELLSLSEQMENLSKELNELLAA